jgi:outer membrane protein TolC
MRHMLFVAALAAAPALTAQQSVPARLSLADAIAIARANNPTYRQILNNRAPAAWSVRNAWSSLLLPNVSANGTLGYTGAGTSAFLTSSFTQSVATRSSSYDVGATWFLSGATLSQPGLAKAQMRAADADVVGANNLVLAGVTQQYLTVLQARENAVLAARQVERNVEFQKLAEARFSVGQTTLIDVRRAQVARGQSEVAQLRALNAVSIEKLRLFEQLGVIAPVDVSTVQLTDTFSVQAPTWQLPQLLTMAESQNPSLKALREREDAANWAVKAVTSDYLPSLSLSLGWAGYTQSFTDLDPIIANRQGAATVAFATCGEQNQIRTNSGLPANDCSGLAWTPADETALRQENDVFPFDFTDQPFQASLRISLPIFTNFSRTQRVSAARADRDDLEESVRRRGLAVQTEVSQAFLTLTSLHQQIAIQDNNRTAAREQLQLATERYRVGSGTFVELLDAQVATLLAEFDYVNVIYDYHKSLATLEQAVGQPLR